MSQTHPASRTCPAAPPAPSRSSAVSPGAPTPGLVPNLRDRASFNIEDSERNKTGGNKTQWEKQTEELTPERRLTPERGLPPSGEFTPEGALTPELPARDPRPSPATGITRPPRAGPRLRDGPMAAGPRAAPPSASQWRAGPGSGRAVGARPLGCSGPAPVGGAPGPARPSAAAAAAAATRSRGERSRGLTELSRTRASGPAAGMSRSPAEVRELARVAARGSEALAVLRCAGGISRGKGRRASEGMRQVSGCGRSVPGARGAPVPRRAPSPASPGAPGAAPVPAGLLGPAALCGQRRGPETPPRAAPAVRERAGSPRWI
ncbi:transcription initiation factor TFIID subunit 4-like [Sylvia atricapilla]|uniref:transcription initiation factor TFIID subunit 4-like n=1 Tax=Sylvia atricapilla TaxID=48155 RepID=UPI003390B168